MLQSSCAESLQPPPQPLAGPDRGLRLRLLVASAEGPIIRYANLQTDHTLSAGDMTPCETCTQSPMRKESCLLIKKTWLETGGNISLVSRRLGISRTTVYKHVTSISLLAMVIMVGVLNMYTTLPKCVAFVPFSLNFFLLVVFFNPL